MDTNKIKGIIEQSEDFSILDYSINPSIISNQRQQEIINKIYFLQSELNETKNNYEKLFNDFLFYKQQCEELLLKQYQYIQQENQQQNNMKDQIEVLKIKNDQLIQENKELLRIQNLNQEESLNKQQDLLQELKTQRDQLLNSNKTQTDLIEQYNNKIQNYDRHNQELIQKVQNLTEELERIKKENDLYQKNIKNDNQQEITSYLENIAKIIIEELKQIDNYNHKEVQQISQRKELTFKLTNQFKEKLMKPLLEFDLQLRHEFTNNKILGQSAIKKKGIQ